ncbi:DUF397 domain-containing protein [Streptomyces sp. NPDC058045]|uniref:DUF397 domain-containing protein n=1 Tax=Streptomyces sp. NPDC058045 TaxID=3346311 RepID=UPI0036EBC29F
MSDRLAWFKSSHSDSDGGNCLEVAWEHTATVTGIRSVHVRDSKLGESGPTFAVDAAAWSAFLESTPRV